MRQNFFEKEKSDFLFLPSTHLCSSSRFKSMLPSPIGTSNSAACCRSDFFSRTTAGLHFTDEVLKEIGEENISSLTLHVGAGTFMPVLSKGKKVLMSGNPTKFYHIHVNAFC